MDKIIATVIGIILVLGLIAYAVLGQVEGAKKSGDKAALEQEKINMMLENPNLVNGSKVKDYAEKASASGYTVTVKDPSGTAMDKDSVTDGGLFEMKKTYKADGSLGTVEFTQKNLGTATTTTE